MSNDPTVQHPVSPPQGQQVNIGHVDGNAGLTGLWGKVGNASALTVLMVAFLYGGHWILNNMMVANREDRLYDRQMFRDSLQTIQKEEDRRAGEIKGAMDAMNGATRELTVEIKSWRRDIRGKAPDKGGPPP